MFLIKRKTPEFLMERIHNILINHGKKKVYKKRAKDKNQRRGKPKINHREYMIEKSEQNKKTKMITSYQLCLLLLSCVKILKY